MNYEELTDEQLLDILNLWRSGERKTRGVFEYRFQLLRVEKECRNRGWKI